MIRFVNSVRVGGKEITFAGHATHTIKHNPEMGAFDVTDKLVPSKTTLIPMHNVGFVEQGEAPKLDAKRSGK